jgi:ABC-type bacteriocin/lantibiotic exporter with double-glycine peptidase domain
MSPVVQEETTGCGIAAVAMLAGVTYRRARSIAQELNISVADERLWSSSYDVRQLLAYFDITAEEGHTTFVSWERLPSRALLAIRWHRRGGGAYWHWVVFWRGPQGPVVLDSKRSLRTNERTDFGRIKPKWYIEVGAPRRRVIGRRSINPAFDDSASRRWSGPRR